MKFISDLVIPVLESDAIPEKVKLEIVYHLILGRELETDQAINICLPIDYDMAAAQRRYEKKKETARLKKARQRSKERDESGAKYGNMEMSPIVPRVPVCPPCPQVSQMSPSIPNHTIPYQSKSQSSKQNHNNGQGLSSQYGLRSKDRSDRSCCPVEWQDFVDFALSLRKPEDSEELFNSEVVSLWNRLGSSGWKTKDRKPITQWQRYVSKCISQNRREGDFTPGESSSVDVEDTYSEVDGGSSSTDNWV